MQSSPLGLDLFYRMNVLTVKMPSLRESREDIEGLAVYFLNMFNRKYNKNKYLSDHVLQNFVQYSWRGNVRELQSLIEKSLKKKICLKK